MRILMRCDADPRTGVGHVVRCLALAEEAGARGHHVAMTGRLEGELVSELVGGVPDVTLLEPDDPDGAEALAERALGYDVVHVDSYDVDPELLGAVLGASTPSHPRGDLLSRPLVSNVADSRHGSRPADLGIDPTPGAQRTPAPASACWWLRGERFVPIRRSVLESRPHSTSPTQSTDLRVLVVMGGTDSVGCAPYVVDALAQAGVCLELAVVATPNTRIALLGRAGRWSTGRMTVIDPVVDLPARMAAADVVITAAGTSLWELCAMGKAMATVWVVENQREGYFRVVEAGAAIGLGSADDLRDSAATAQELRPLLTDASIRQVLGVTAGAFIDGLGAWRIVSAWEAIREGATPSRSVGSVSARPAATSDAKMLWIWRNDPLTRAHSRSSDEIPLDQHVMWLQDTLRRADRLLLIGEDFGGPVGTVRWDHKGDGEWEVSITVAPDRRGEGFGTSLLAAGEDALWAHRCNATQAAGGSDRLQQVWAYLAYVHVGNPASRWLFLRSGYLPDLPPDSDGLERLVKPAVRRAPS